MLITRRLIKELIETKASVILNKGLDENRQPQFTIATVDCLYGIYDPDGRKCGIFFEPALNGIDHFPYCTILGYNTGKEASVQELLLYKGIIGINAGDTKEVIQALINSKPPNPKITFEKLTTTLYYFKDNWSGNVLNFVTLRDAKRYAKRQTGVSVTIYSVAKGYCEISCITPASGYCPP